MIKCPKCGSDVIKTTRYKNIQKYKCPKCDYKIYREYVKPSYIEHFGVKVKDNNLKINRDNYAIINKTNHHRDHIRPEDRDNRKVFEDESCATYTDEYCMLYQKCCLENYDLNMKYFNSLDSDEFNKELTRILEYFKYFEKVTDLNTYEDIPGIYIMVLDEYKQMYIGKTNSLKKRIMTHWTKKQEFDRLIFGPVNRSVISINCFGALDTTRLFVYPVDDPWCYEIESIIVDYANKKFILNRVRGGDIYPMMDINIIDRKLN